MFQWILQGLKAGVKTKDYSRESELSARIAPEFPESETVEKRKMRKLPKAFQHSLNLFIVDTGDCGACLNEIKRLNTPYYNFHHLGFFVTPTPRNADVLLIIGPIVEHMKLPLKKAYEAMPEPKKVLAVGTCPISGCVFGPSFISSGVIPSDIPVDLSVPGCPPSPLAVLDALMKIAGKNEIQP